MNASQSGGSSSLVVSFADIERITAELRASAETVQQLVGRVGPLAFGSDLIGSAILSPVTATLAEEAVLAAAANLQAYALQSTALAFVADTAVDTYELADSALAQGARALAQAHDLALRITHTVVSDTTQVLGDIGAAAGVVDTLGIGVFGLLNSMGAGFLGEAFVDWNKSFGQSMSKLSANPWTALVGPLAFWLEMGDALPRNFDTARAWQVSLDLFQRFLGGLGPGFDRLVSGLIGDLHQFGWNDGGHLVAQLSSDKGIGLRARGKVFLNSMATAGSADTTLDRTDDVVPTSVPTLLLSMGQIGAMGGTDEAVIRVVATGTPPAFTLIIPPTGEWSPWGSVPDDINGDLAIMTGHSHLEQLADQALSKAIADYNTGHPSDPPITAKLSAVMVAGFSQGGITAAAFAQDFNNKYDIKQVVTIGAPIANFSIPESVHVLAYESADDVMPRLDGRENPQSPNWQTIKGDDGGGFPGSHDAILYSKLAATAQQPNDPSIIAQFLSPMSTITDYYAVK